MCGMTVGRSPTRSARTRVRRRTAVAALAVAAAVILVALVSSETGRDGRDEGRAPAAGGPRTLAAGGVAVVQAPGWAPPARPLSVPGMRFEEQVALVEEGSDLMLVAGTLPASTMSLLPAELLSQLSFNPSEPTRVRLRSNLHAYHYARLAYADRSDLLDVYAVPTTEGVATVSCLAGPAATPVLDDCLTIAASLTLTRGEPLPLGADAAFRQRYGGAIAQLAAQRRDARRQLGRARDPARQAAPVARLARDYRRAARSLAPLVPPAPRWPRDTVRTMRRVARAYEDVAAALSAQSRSALARARRAANAGERRLERAPWTGQRPADTEAG
jgi:hypothetical protein